MLTGFLCREKRTQLKTDSPGISVSLSASARVGDRRYATRSYAERSRPMGMLPNSTAPIRSAIWMPGTMLFPWKLRGNCFWRRRAGCMCGENASFFAELRRARARFFVNLVNQSGYPEYQQHGRNFHGSPLRAAAASSESAVHGGGGAVARPGYRSEH